MNAGFSRYISPLLLMVVALVAACESTIPQPPPVTVNITAVQNQQAVDDAVNATLTGVAQAGLDETATVFAQGGVTLTPSWTPSPTRTPTNTPTRFFTPTRTPTPTTTPTPTFAPYSTNTPAPIGDGATAWVRVLQAWQDLSVATPGLSTSLDVYINDQRVQRGLSTGQATPYVQVTPGAVRVSLRAVDENAATPNPPLLSTVLEASAGGVLALIANDFGAGLSLFAVREDLSPLDDNTARLTIVQNNAELVPVNLLAANAGRALAYNLNPGQILGPLDLPSGEYTIDLHDQVAPDQYLESLPRMNLTSRLNYLLVLIPYRREGAKLTDSFLFPGATRLLETDLSARFVNVAASVGPVKVNLDNLTQFEALPVGTISDPVPLSAVGAYIQILNENGLEVFDDVVGPWPGDDRLRDKIVLISDGLVTETSAGATVTVLSQNAPRSAINASIRLIHALPGTVPLSLEIRPRMTELVTNDDDQIVEVKVVDEAKNPWIPTGQQASLGSASEYLSRVPNTYDVRVVPVGTRNVIAGLGEVQLLAGGVYDFMIVLGAEPGSARMELLQPVAQFTSLAMDEGDPTAIAEAVEATLTAQAPDVTATPTRAVTPTTTPTPVATNTPRPTNTPGSLPPLLIIDPAPPNTVIDRMNLLGAGFAPGRSYTVRLDDSVTLGSGTIGADGSFGVSLALPRNVAPGPHTLQICVDCRSGGLQQAQYLVIIVAEPEVTPTATARP